MPEDLQGPDGNWYILLAGLPSTDLTLVLAPGLALRPLEAPLSIFDLAAAGAVGFTKWAAVEPFSVACNAEIESAMDSATTPGFDALNRAWLVSTLLLFRGYTRHWAVACCNYSWNNVAGFQTRNTAEFKRQAADEGIHAAVYKPNRTLPPFRGDLLDYHLTCLVDSDCRNSPPTSLDAAWICANFEVFNRLAAESESFRFALLAANDWRFAKETRSAVARLWSGIEALFRINSELVFKLSLYAACILAPRGNCRKQKFEEVKTLYNLRSRIVHGEALPSEKLYAAMSGSFHLLRDLLIAASERGHLFTQTDIDESVFH